MLLNFLTEEVEKSLSNSFGEKVNLSSSGSIGGGCINNASKIITNVGTFFLKWNDNCASDIFIREAEGLKELKKAAGNHLFVPNVFASKLVDSTPGFLVLEYLSTDYSVKNNDEQLGRGLGMIHQYSNPEFGFNKNNYCGATLQNNTWKKNWLEFFRDNRILYLLNLIQKKRSLLTNESRVFEQLMDKLPSLIPNESTPALIHGDLWSGNYMFCNKGAALIDPASYYADREMEFGIMTMFGGFSQKFYDSYHEVNPLPMEWKSRNLLYQIYHVLNHYYLFGGGYKNQAIQMAKKFL